jgi:hypothetical protein
MRANLGSEAVAGAYGRNLGTKFGAEDAPSIVTRSLRSSPKFVCTGRSDGFQTPFRAWMHI